MTVNYSLHRWRSGYCPAPGKVVVGSAVCHLWRSLRLYRAIFLWLRPHFVCQANASSSALASRKSFVSNPSVNQV
jgi:hypothetical protein